MDRVNKALFENHKPSIQAVYTKAMHMATRTPHHLHIATRTLHHQNSNEVIHGTELSSQHSRRVRNYAK
jgi:hypothetical protein